MTTSDARADFEAQVAQWRAYVLKRKGIGAADADELESHLRDQAADLQASGLASDEAFLVAVKRLGAQDDISREFARVHSDRLWKQLVLAGTDVFLALAGLSGIVSPTPAGNPSNADGTILASTLVIESSGLVIQRAPGVSNGKAIVSNRSAAEWHEDGPRFATSEDVAKLGQNVGVYSFAAPAVYAPAGVVEVTFI